MARGVPLTDDDKLRICELLEEHVHPNEIAKQLQLSHQSVYRVRKEMYGKDVRSMDTTIAGDKYNGTLKAVGPGHFVGTCRTTGGKMKTKHFNFPNSKQAIEAWDNWKALTSIERVKAKGNKKTEKEKTDIPEKETFVATYDNSQILQANKPVHQNTMVENLYILAVGKPKLAGWFVDEDKARQALKLANQALEFAGVDIRYSVVQVKVNGFLDVERGVTKVKMKD